jgi:hypothetical protein
LNTLNEELKRGKDQLKIAIESGDVNKIKNELEKIKRIEEDIRREKNKIKTDLANFYYEKSKETGNMSGTVDRSGSAVVFYL